VSDHLAPATLSALADGELSSQELAAANQHLTGCSLCTSQALHESLMKTAVARAGQRYTPPSSLEERLRQAVRQDSSVSERSHPASTPHASPTFGWRWAAIAAIVVVVAALGFMQQVQHQNEIAAGRQSAAVTEVFDQHLATLARNLPPQVLSSDKHTVKPWFQGKIPFSFSLPDKLPENTTLEGADLSYLHDQPVAQLLYTIGKHRVSVFVRQGSDSTNPTSFAADRSGYHVVAAEAGGLEIVAISDTEPSHLQELVNALEQAQTR
jgi:anti-sigma factor RsiW